MKKYNVGDIVWIAKVDSNRQLTIPCPICFGKCKVTLILGNDDTVELPCDYCRNGYNAPTGIVTECDYYVGAEKVYIHSVTIEETCDGIEYKYMSGNFVLYNDRVFDTKEEAVEYCKKLVADLKDKDERRTEYLKQDCKKNFSWNAGYHLREAKRKEKEAAQHKEKAKLCKAKSKEENV